MSFLAKLSRFFGSDRFTAAGAARRLDQELRGALPEMPWTLDLARPDHPSVALTGRLIVTLEDCRDGVEAQILEPGKPGRDDPPFVMRAAYNVTNLVHTLSWRARIEPGTVVLHALRVDAIYELLQDFTDHHGGAFAAGTRLTFVQRHFLPYHGGHTLQFREATI